MGPSSMSVAFIRALLGVRAPSERTYRCERGVWLRTDRMMRLVLPAAIFWRPSGGGHERRRNHVVGNRLWRRSLCRPAGHTRRDDPQERALGDVHHRDL